MIYGSNVAIFICKQIFSGYLTSYKLSGSVMPSSSFGSGLLPVILFPTFCVLLLVIDFLQFEWHCHAILIFGKQIASSDLTSHGLNGPVMPSPFLETFLVVVITAFDTVGSVRSVTITTTITNPTIDTDGIKLRLLL